MRLIFFFYWFYPQTSASYVYDFGSWRWCLTCLIRLYLCYSREDVCSVIGFSMTVLAPITPIIDFGLSFLRRFWRKFPPILLGYVFFFMIWCSSKKLFLEQNFFCTEMSKILASVQYELTWPIMYSSTRTRAARFYLSILQYVIWEVNINTQNYLTI